MVIDAQRRQRLQYTLGPHWHRDKATLHSLLAWRRLFLTTCVKRNETNKGVGRALAGQRK